MNEKIGIKVSIVTIIVNAVLAIFKLIAGIIGKSSAMISDSVHSFSDVFSTIIVIIGLIIARKKSDESHPYGHERFENVAGIILAFCLLVTGVLIGVEGINNLIAHDYVVPSKFVLGVAVISIAVKEWMYHYTIKAAKKINSDALKADAWHHRSDALSSVGSLIGIAGTIMGLWYFDIAACIIIALLIIKVSIDIFKEAISKMIDKSCDDETVDQIKNLVFETDGVLGIDELKTRIFGNKIYIDLEITADRNLTFEKAHEIAHDVHDKIEDTISSVKHCMVHVNPK
ncbi:MAG: cation transporter [Bacilli bacterium]|nr:cation transporter [Bacilli bacterium]